MAGSQSGPSQPSRPIASRLAVARDRVRSADLPADETSDPTRTATGPEDRGFASGGTLTATAEHRGFASQAPL